jgi:release factor glutamine methyltransferase
MHSLTLNEWLEKATLSLSGAGDATARLDCLVLLEDEVGKDRAWLLSHAEHVLGSDQVEALNTKVVQRAKHTPLAYIRGKTEFYGREFIVSPAVLEPRPESETMIDLLLDLPAARTQKWRIADIGTGSGALGITAQLELPSTQVDLLEIDKHAVEIAKMNVIKFTASISVTKSDLLQSAPQTYDILLCNLPYVPDEFHINTAASHEPKIAIYGGPDGLDIYRRLFGQIAKPSNKPLFVLTESLPPQHKQLAAIAQTAGYKLTKTDDFIQLFEPA